MAKKTIQQTSKDAFHSLNPEDLRDMYRDIMKALAILGTATFEDIAAHLKVDKSRVWKRLSEMERLELIYRPGTKKILKSGRQGYEWALTSANLIKTEKPEKALPGKSVADYSKSIQDISKQLPLL